MEISDGMDIASYAMMNSQLQISQGVSTQVLKKTMDLQEAPVSYTHLTLPTILLV